MAVHRAPKGCVLKVDNLHVSDIMHVGGNGKPFVRIVALNESADISLVGKGEDTSSLRLSVGEGVGTGGYTSISLIGGGEDAPRMIMRVEKGIGVGIDGESHAKRPEAAFRFSQSNTMEHFVLVCLLGIRVEQMM